MTDIMTGHALLVAPRHAMPDSGCGWPAFTKPINDKEGEGACGYHPSDDPLRKYALNRANSTWATVFNDGPKDKGGLRYCINSGVPPVHPQDKDEATPGTAACCISSGASPRRKPRPPPPRRRRSSSFQLRSHRPCHAKSCMLGLFLERASHARDEVDSVWNQTEKLFMLSPISGIFRCMTCPRRSRACHTVLSSRSTDSSSLRPVEDVRPATRRAGWHACFTGSFRRLYLDRTTTTGRRTLPDLNRDWCSSLLASQRRGCLCVSHPCSRPPGSWYRSSCAWSWLGRLFFSGFQVVRTRTGRPRPMPTRSTGRPWRNACSGCRPGGD